MKKLNKYIAAVAALVAATGCTNQEEPTLDRVNEDGMHVYNLELNASLADELGSRAGREWTSSDYIYIAFENGADIIWAYAYYNTYYETWTLYATASLPENVATANCTTWFFDGNSYGSISSSTKEISVSSDQTPYVSKTTYSIVNNTVVISSTMSPDLGRFRIRSAEYNSNSCSVGGPWFPALFSFENNTLILNNNPRTFTTTTYEEDGYYYSNYLSAYYFDDSERDFKIQNGDKVYIRSFANKPDVLQEGTSGYIDLPTESSHDGWDSYDFFRESASNKYFGSASEVAEGEAYYFHTMVTRQSPCGVNVTVDYQIRDIYSGTEPCKKSALLYIEVYDGDPDNTGNQPLTQTWTELYTPESELSTYTTYNTSLSMTLPSSFVTTGDPYYRVSILTDGVYVYVSRYIITNFF